MEKGGNEGGGKGKEGEETKGAGAGERKTGRNGRKGEC